MKDKLQNLVYKINQNKFNIYLILYIFATIILSRNTMISSYIVGFEKSVYISVMLSIPIIILFFKKLINKELDVKKIKIILPFIIAILISIIIKRDWQLYNISILFYICISIALASIMDFNTFK